MATTYLTKTYSNAGDTKKWTFSAWVKKSKIANNATLFHAKTTGNTNFESLILTSGGNFDWEHYEYTSSAYKGRLKTNRLFRDASAWYHIVCVFDSANATAGNRMRLYVNGTEETSFSIDTNPTQNQDSIINAANAHNIGGSGASLYLDGLLSHVHFCDGYVYAASDFGSTDSTTGEWKINTSPSVSYGTNGFFLLKDNNGVTDQSGQSNNYTVAAGTLSNTQDCPSDVFATLNPLTRQASLLTLSNGNTTMTTPSGTQFNTATSTLAMSSGKYYFEVKRIAERGLVGITNVETPQINGTAQYYNGDTANSNDYGYYSDDGKVYNNGNPSGSGATWGNGDIVGCAVDLDNRKIYWHKNGTYINSGNPSAGSGGQTIPSDLTYYFAVSGYTSTTFQCNFGDGFFGTTAISSEGTNASGIGKFEYDVPTGYTALSTKGLNE